MMTHNHRSMIAAISLVLATLSCNSPLANPTPEESAPEIQTAAAQTLQVILTPSITATTQQSLIPNTPIATATKVGAFTQTPTYSVPMLTVREQTNCRAGPGQDYEILFTYLAGKQLEIAGRYDPNNFWLVNAPESPTGTCWLWGEYVEVTGSYWVVPSVTPPGTATLAPPQAPSMKNWEYSCSGGTMTVLLEWTDKATDETGYRVFRNGEMLVELPANSASYTDSVALLSGEDVEYYVQVYAPGGSANTNGIRMSC
ncbi:MAG: SH3 domain-containing protein [Chloroflexota bacterium]